MLMLITLLRDTLKDTGMMTSTLLPPFILPVAVKLIFQHMALLRTNSSVNSDEPTLNHSIKTISAQSMSGMLLLIYDVDFGIACDKLSII